jgi:hypothetical protein
VKFKRVKSIYLRKRTFMRGFISREYVFLSYTFGTIAAVRKSDYSLAWEMPAKRYNVLAELEGTLILGSDLQNIRGLDPATGVTRWLAGGWVRVAGERLYADVDETTLTELDASSGRVIDTWECPWRYGPLIGRTMLLELPDAGGLIGLYDLDLRKRQWTQPVLGPFLHDPERRCVRGSWLTGSHVVEQSGAAFRGTEAATGRTVWTWHAPEDVGQASCLAGRILMHVGGQLLALHAGTGEIAWLHPLDELGSPALPPRTEWLGAIVVVGGVSFKLRLLSPQDGMTLGTYDKTPDFVSLVPAGADLLAIRNYGRVDIVTSTAGR